jgi:hypothetical protein
MQLNILALEKPSRVVRTLKIRLTQLFAGLPGLWFRAPSESPDLRHGKRANEQTIFNKD